MLLKMLGGYGREKFFPKSEAHAKDKFFSIYKPTGPPLLSYKLFVSNQYDQEFSGREESDLVLRIEIRKAESYTDYIRFRILKRKSRKRNSY